MRQCPWRDSEWKELKRDLWSGEMERVQRGIDKIHDWSLVGELPFEIEITSSLLKLDCMGEESSVESETVESLCAISVIRSARLTAALRDNRETLCLRPGSELPLSVGSARNRYVHGERPSLEHLRAVCQVSKDFIRYNYWDYYEEILSTRKDPIKALIDYFYGELEQSFPAGVLECLGNIDMHKFIVSGVDPPQKSDNEANEKFCRALANIPIEECTIALRHVYLAESFLELSLDSLKNNTGLSKSPSSRMLKWAPVVAEGLNQVEADLDSLELERIIQKILDLVKELTDRSSHLSNKEVEVEQFLNEITRIFDWFASKTRHTETTSQLRSIFRSLLQQFQSPSNPHKKPRVESMETEEAGVFTREPDWDICAFGTFPLNYSSKVPQKRQRAIERFVHFRFVYGKRNFLLQVLQLHKGRASSSIFKNVDGQRLSVRSSPSIEI